MYNAALAATIPVHSREKGFVPLLPHRTKERQEESQESLGGLTLTPKLGTGGVIYSFPLGRLR